MTKDSLSPQSTLEELFDFIRNPEQDVQVQAVTVSKPSAAEARLMIIIQGKPQTSHVLLAQLMSYIQEMHDLAEQKRAELEIVAPNGEPLSDDPQILVP